MTEDKEDKAELEYYKSDQFKKDMAEAINAGTWDKGLPKIYMNKEGDIVEHWKDGTINILKPKDNESL